MKKILILGATILLVAALVTGGTWAYFSDTETSSNNVLSAGTLDLGLANSSGGEAGAGATQTWTTPSGWKPGDNISATLYVKNSGTIAMNTVSVNLTTAIAELTPATVHPTSVDPTDFLGKNIVVQGATWNGTNISNLGLAAQTLSTANNTVYTLPTGLQPGSEALLFINFLFSTNATNGCQGDTATVTATLISTQQ